MYLRSHKLPAYIMDSYYVRSDVQNRMLGITASYVFNGKKFSIRPPFKFDTWQKKSAGSFLAGIEYLMGSMKGDSSIIPSAFSNEFSQKQIDEMKYIVFGPNVGYGYMLVIKKYFYFSALASLNGDIGFTQEKNSTINDTYNKHWSFSPNFSVRGGIGYNAPKWQLAVSYFTKHIYMNGQKEGALYRTQNDDIRLSYTRRINAGKRIPKTINWAGNIIEKLGFGFLIK